MRKNSQKALIVGDLIMDLWFAQSAKDYVVVNTTDLNFYDFFEYVSQVLGYRPGTIDVGSPQTSGTKSSIDLDKLISGLKKENSPLNHIKVLNSYPGLKELLNQPDFIKSVTAPDDPIALNWNNKIWVRERCRQLGIPVFAHNQVVISSLSQESVKKVLDMADHYAKEGILVQLPAGDGGKGNLVLRKLDDGKYYCQFFDDDKTGAGLTEKELIERLRNWVRSRASETSSLIIAPWFEISASPAISLMIQETPDRVSVVPIAITDQVLVLPHHASIGIRYPADYEKLADYVPRLMEDSLKICHSLVQDGYRGWVGIDFAFGSNHQDGQEYGLVEVNARLLATSYALRIAELHAPEINLVEFMQNPPFAIVSDKQVNVNRPASRFRDFLAYLQSNQVPLLKLNGNTKEGIVIIDPPGSNHKIWVVSLAPGLKRAEAMLNQVRQLLA